MNVTRPALGILLASLLAACSAIRPPVAATPAPAAAPKPSTEDSDESRLPRLELDERILFSVVAGEIAGQRGHTGAAAGTFLELLAEHARDGGAGRLRPELAAAATRFEEARAEQVLARAAERGIRFVIPGDPEWPAQLGDLAHAGSLHERGCPPVGLWVRGPLRLDQLGGSVAVVGSRSSTTYGEQVAADLAAVVAGAGRPVVSGGAFGIDYAAHRGALAGDGATLLVSSHVMDEAERCTQVFVMHKGLLLAEGAPGALRERARGVTYVATPPSGMPARDLQARLIDADRLIVDAVPKGGAVWFIRQPKVETHVLDGLLGDIDYQPRPEELEDAFMMMLRQQHAEGAESTTRVSASSPGAPTSSPQMSSNGNGNGPVIVVRDLVRTFGDFTAVASTSFDVARGEIFGLLGPNGAGKTTTFRMLCGLLPASSGHLEVAGMNLRTARAQARARIGYVSQKFALYGNLTVRENLEFFGGAYGLRGQALRTRVAATLAQFGLEPTAISGLLPGGYKQRLAMATGLLHEPDILFLDEPTSGIDPLARRAFWRTITALAQAGVTVIVTTHFMEEAEYCDRIAIQDAGKVLALGTPQAVREQAGGDGGADMNSAFISIVEHGRAKATEGVAA